VNERLISVAEVATRVGCSERQIEKLIAKGDGPRSIKFGRLRRFRESEVNRWIADLSQQQVAA